MIFTVQDLRDLFAFPGEDPNRQVDVSFGDANGGSVAVGSIDQMPELGVNLFVRIALPDGYYLTTQDPLRDLKALAGH